MQCPTCATEIAADSRFVPWCPSCEWGLETGPGKPKDRLAERRERLNVKLSDRLFTEVVSDSAERVTSLRVLTVSAAVAVHLVTVGLLVVGLLLFLIHTSLGTAVQDVLGTLLLLVGLAVQPVNLKNLIVKPKSGGIRIGRTDAPALFDCLDQIARIVGTTTPDVVVVGPEFNASIRVLPRRQVELRVGLALWFALTWPERVAILSHELAHRVNGDMRRGVLVGGALLTLHRWAYLFRPDTIRPGHRITHPGSRGSLVILGEMLLPLILFPATLAILASAWTLRLFANRQGQRSEYIADKIAADVGGTSATTAALEKLSLAQSVQLTVSRTVKWKQSDSPWTTLEAYAESIPDSELERLRRLGARKYEQIDTTHPPNFMRAEAVRRRPDQEPGVVLDSATQQQITAELQGPAVRCSHLLERFYGV